MKLKTNYVPKTVELKDLNQIDRQLKGFSNFIATEMGQMLATVIGELDYAFTTTNDLTRSHCIATALGITERALNLAKNLKYFTNQEALKKEACDLSKIVVDSAETLQKEFQARALRVKVLTEAPAIVLLSPDAVQHAVINVLLATADQTPHGGDLCVALKIKSGSVEILFSRSGTISPKLSPEEVLLLGKATTREPDPALSLGLLVAKSIVEAHAGQITSHEESGHEAKLAIQLPYDPSLPPPSYYPSRRRCHRIGLQLPVSLKLKDTPEMKATMTSLSENGCYIRLSNVTPFKRPSNGDVGALTLWYFGTQSVEIEQFRIVRATWNGPEAGIGVEFVKMGQKAKKIIAAVVKGHSP